MHHGLRGMDVPDCLPLILVRVFIPQCVTHLSPRRPAAYYEISSNFIASVLNYDIFSRHFADLRDAIDQWFSNFLRIFCIEAPYKFCDGSRSSGKFTM